MTQIVKRERPQRGQSIFRSDDPIDLNARIEMVRGNWIHFAEGYKEVALRAWRHLIDHGGDASFDDREIFAFAFLWRHYLELMLKALVQVCATSNCENLLNNHSLLPLWQAIKPTLKAQSWWDSCKEDIALVEQVIDDFHKLDKSSIDFRYPSNKEWTATTLQDAPEQINVACLNSEMAWVAGILNGTFDALTNGEISVQALDNEEARTRRLKRLKEERKRRGLP